MSKFNLYFIAALAFALPACSGGGGGGGVDGKQGVSPKGVYHGFASSDVTGITSPVIAIVSNDGEARLFSTGNLTEVNSVQQLVTQVGNGAGSFSGAIRVYQPTDPVFLGVLRSAGTASGTVSELDGKPDGIDGSYRADNGDSGSFSLSYDHATTMLGSRLKSLQGSWSVQTADGYAITLTARDDGSLFGSDSKGCVYDGKAAIVDSYFNVYRVTAAVTCPRVTYAATGLATRLPKSGATPERLALEISNDDRAYFNVLDRVF